MFPNPNNSFNLPGASGSETFLGTGPLATDRQLFTETANVNQKSLTPSLPSLGGRNSIRRRFLKRYLCVQKSGNKDQRALISYRKPNVCTVKLTWCWSRTSVLPLILDTEHNGDRRCMHSPPGGRSISRLRNDPCVYHDEDEIRVRCP